MPKESIFDDERRVAPPRAGQFVDMKHRAEIDIDGPNGPVKIICHGMTEEEAQSRARGAAMFFNVKR